MLLTFSSNPHGSLQWRTSVVIAKTKKPQHAYIPCKYLRNRQVGYSSVFFPTALVICSQLSVPPRPLSFWLSPVHTSSRSRKAFRTVQVSLFLKCPCGRAEWHLSTDNLLTWWSSWQKGLLTRTLLIQSTAGLWAWLSYFNLARPPQSAWKHF